MSASIDKEDSTDPGGGSREVLASWLEAHAAGECDAQTMQTRFLEACRRHPEAPWDALALLDQYQRRGKLEPPLARTLKAEIAQMVFGVAREAGDGEPTPPRPAKTSGPRPVQWQRPASPAPPPEASAAEEEEEDDDDDAESESSAAPVAPGPLGREVARHPPVAPAVVPTRADLQLPRTSIEVGSVLRDRYELQRVLGRGADGVVYRALDRNRRHLADGQRHVAVKVLRSQPPLSAESLIDVQRRAHQAQMLLHPHIARVYDFDHQGDVHFIVMEWVQGELLEMLLQSAQRFSIGRERALKIIRDTGSALAYAHEHGVILGNLTPRKIMVTSGGDAKLIDVGFSIARAADDRAEESRSQYDARYASLERVQGEPLTTSDDVYALACIAYELLTGRHPYDGHSGAAARVQARTLDPITSLGRDQWQALERALRVSRSERDITVAQLVASLSATPAAHPAAAETREIVATGADPTSIRAERRRDDSPVTPNRTGVRWLVVLMVLGVAGAAAWWFTPAQEREQLKENIADVAQATINPNATRSQVEALPPTTTQASRALETGASSPTGVTDNSAEVVPEIPAAASPPPTETKPIPDVKDASPAPVPANKRAPTASTGTNNGIIGFPKDTYVVRESDVVVRIPVTRTRGTRGEVGFRWSLEGNSAEAGADFAAVGPGTEYLTPGQASTVLHIPLVSDSRREGTEMFLVHLDEAIGGARLGELTRAAVIIVDDD